MSVSNPLFLAPDNPQPLDLPEPPVHKSTVNRPPQRAAQADAQRRSLQMHIRALAGQALDPERDRNERMSIWRQLRSKCQKIAPLLVNDEERELCERIAFHGQPARHELPDLLRASLRTRPKS